MPAKKLPNPKCVKKAANKACSPKAGDGGGGDGGGGGSVMADLPRSVSPQQMSRPGTAANLSPNCLAPPQDMPAMPSMPGRVSQHLQDFGVPDSASSEAFTDKDGVQWQVYTVQKTEEQKAAEAAEGEMVDNIVAELKRLRQFKELQQGHLAKATAALHDTSDLLAAEREARVEAEGEVELLRGERDRFKQQAEAERAARLELQLAATEEPPLPAARATPPQAVSQASENPSCLKRCEALHEEMRAGAARHSQEMAALRSATERQINALHLQLGEAKASASAASPSQSPPSSTAGGPRSKPGGHSVKFERGGGSSYIKAVCALERGNGRIPANFERLDKSEDWYQFGSKRVEIKEQGGQLVVRVGGGFLPFIDFVYQFGHSEASKLAHSSNVTSGGRFEVPTLVRKSRGGPSSQGQAQVDGSRAGDRDKGGSGVFLSGAAGAGGRTRTPGALRRPNR